MEATRSRGRAPSARPAGLARAPGRAGLLGGWLVVLLLAAVACAGGDPPPPAASLEPCTSPRPQMCTQDYRPACGHRCEAPPCGESDRKTYSNACSACSDATVTAVAPGPCEGAEAEGASRPPGVGSESGAR